MKLEAKNIFIDTSAYMQNNFDYSNSSFSALKSLIKSGDLRLFITIITENEIKSNIKQEIDKARVVTKKFSNEGRILWSVTSFDFKTLFRNKKLDNVEDELIEQLNKFLKETKAKYIPINNVNPEKVFDLYFEVKPPFGSGDKKEEFPDAFVIEALKDWCDKNDDKIYVISNDKDFKTALTGNTEAIYLKNIEQFLDLYNKFMSDLPDKILDILDDVKVLENIEDKIKEEFETIVFWLDDEDGAVEDVEATDVTIEDRYVINSTNDYAELDVDAEITFSAEVSFLDNERSYYDKEEGKYLVRNYLKGRVQRKIRIPVKLEIELDAVRKEFISVQSVVINRKRDIEFSANKYEEHYEEYD